MPFRIACSVVLIVVLSACGGSSNSSAPLSPSPSPPSSTTAAVSIPTGAQTLGSSAYVPNPLTITAGTTVTWKNTDSIAHTVTSDAGAFNSSTLGAGAIFSFTFSAKGTFPYHCTFHPGMIGSVIVQ